MQMDLWKAKNAVNKMKIVKRRKQRKNGAKMSKTVLNTSNASPAMTRVP